MTTAPARAFLDVERSLSGKRWRARLANEREAAALAAALDLPAIVANVLAARGVALEAAATFLNPTLRALLPDPSGFRDMDRAVVRLTRAIVAGETIGILADYDVDGAASAALLARFFAALGRSVPVYVPDRIKEGYGPSLKAFQALKDAGCAVVVTLDCGTTAYAPLAAAAAAGIDVIVVDHHIAEGDLPAAYAIVNPNRADEDTPHNDLAAVGVTFLLVVALNRTLREQFWYGEGHPEPDLLRWLDLVALGTICDVVPLTGVNRAFVAQGLRVMGRRENTGIAALAEAARLAGALDAYHAGFMLGPRVNAGGRVGEAGLGARILATEDKAEAYALAQRLERYNTERREIEAAVLASAMHQGEAQAAAGRAAIVASGEGWHPGVIGIVAGRLKDRFNRPSSVVALKDGIGKGSARSVPGIAFGSLVIAARREGLLIDGGGHAMAAGFTVAADRLQEFADHLCVVVAAKAGDMPPPSLGLDGALSPAAATTDLVDSLDRAGPFGQGNPRPRFAFPAVTIVRAEIVGGAHIRCFVSTSTERSRLKAIAFRAAGEALGKALLGAGGVALHIAGHLRAETWQGNRSAELVIEDAAPTAAR